ncbi:MAG: ABC transporter ATP-binding protein [Acidimicrobiaceae bacterium]|nr:ABC transporter ATP-binding protein [Acidimicrobiaceae bacterium]
MSESILRVENFSVDYGVGDRAVRAVHDVTFSLGRSEVLGIAGESGSGKSTLVYGLTRLLRAPGVIRSGSASLTIGEEGQRREIDLLSADERELRALRWRHISVVLQSALSALNPVRRIGKEFDEVLRYHGQGTSRAERRARAEELLAMVGLKSDRLDRFPHELSGGQRQRVMIALALALSPDLVIMDEPTTALDVVTQREIIDELRELRERLGFAMIFITHDLSLLVELAEQIMVMYAGRVVERADSSDLYAIPRHPYTVGLMNSFPPLSGEIVPMSGIPGSPPSLASLPTGCAFHPRCPLASEECSLSSPPLVVEGSRSLACFHSSPSVRERLEIRS